MHKTLLSVISLVLALALCGCSAASIPLSAEGLPDAEQTQMPEPEQEGLMKAFGREVNVAVWGEDAVAAAARETLSQLGIPYTDVSNAEEANACDAAIITVDDSFGMGDTDVPALICTNNPYMERENGAVVLLSGSIVQKALDVMFNYPSHEAPIRILGLFTSNTSEAAAEFETMRADGKLYTKGEYFETVQSTDAETPAVPETTPDAQTPADPESWTKEALAGVAVGQLDTIFAENTDLALAAYRALRAANRNDAVEVICAGCNDEILSAMREDHFSMGAFAADNSALAGKLAAYMTVELLNGNTPENATVEPLTGYSDAMEDIDSQNDALAEAYITATVSYLLEYNA